MTLDLWIWIFSWNQIQGWFLSGSMRIWFKKWIFFLSVDRSILDTFTVVRTLRRVLFVFKFLTCALRGELIILISALIFSSSLVQFVNFFTKCVKARRYVEHDMARREGFPKPITRREGKWARVLETDFISVPVNHFFRYRYYFGPDIRIRIPKTRFRKFRSWPLQVGILF